MSNGSQDQDFIVSDAIRLMCSTSFGVLDRNFLCQSLGVVNPRPPLALQEKDTVAMALEALTKNKVGCLVVNGPRGELKGIFSERDFVLKCAAQFEAIKNDPISSYMTLDPVTQPAESTIAYALTLMSQGGFRHLPIVDEQECVIGIISVKHIIDYIANTVLSDLLQFKEAKE